MTEPELNYCPTQGGTFLAYGPEFRTKERSWTKVPTTKNQSGVPYPSQFGGIMSTICLFGHAQAKALMWAWVAAARASGDVVDVRLVEYEVEYDIKAKVIDDTDVTLDIRLSNETSVD